MSEGVKLRQSRLTPCLGFLMYCLTVLVFTLVMVYAVAPKYGRKNPLVYLSICSLVGSVSVMAVKGFGVALKLTLGGNNQFSHPSTYVFGIVTVLCILVQMNYFNKALDIFSTNVYVIRLFSVFTLLIDASILGLVVRSVNPIYYVGFSTATLVASLILFQGLNTSDGITTVSLLCGFVITFLGVHLLNISRTPEPVLPYNGHAHRHSTLDGGLMNPRLSVSGRISIDGWNGVVPADYEDSGLHSASRRSALYRHQSGALFNAFEDGQDDRPREAVGLQDLREDSEEDDDFERDDLDERTLLRSDARREREHERGGSRHERPRITTGIHSPRISPRTN